MSIRLTKENRVLVRMVSLLSLVVLDLVHSDEAQNTVNARTRGQNVSQQKLHATFDSVRDNVHAAEFSFRRIRQCTQ
jgi:hypothetical protein